ncbi:MAG: inositol monophosphatase family protein [Baekduia sp.]
MAASSSGLEGLSGSEVWLDSCRRAAQGLRDVLREHPTSAQRVVETGTVGEGGDRTLVIDRLAEDQVFGELQRLHDRGERFTVISEERGRVDFGSDERFVVVDPLDGSLNAKRGLRQHALSIAVADGPTMADVVLGYVLDLGSGDEWHAIRGEGAFLAGEPVRPQPERRLPDGRFELVAMESTDPRHLVSRADSLQRLTNRVRAFGVMAVTLCQVAETRVDAAFSWAGVRAVDVAAAQLIVRESGGVVEFVGCPQGPLGAPLDLEPRHPIVAARTAEAIDRLRDLPVTAPAAR